MSATKPGGGDILTVWTAGHEPVISYERASAILDAAKLPIAEGMCRHLLVQMVASEAIEALHCAFWLADREPLAQRRGRPSNPLHDHVVPRIGAMFQLTFGQPPSPGTSVDGETPKGFGPFVRVLDAFFRGIVEGIPRERLPDGVAKYWIGPLSIGATREAARDPKPRGKDGSGAAPKRRRLKTEEEEREAASAERARWPAWLAEKAVFGHLEARRAEYAVATGQPWPAVVVTAPLGR